MPSILILTTGGTIDKLYFDALSEYHIGDSVVDRLLAIARVTYPVRQVSLMRKDSLELTDADRALIAATVRDAPEPHIVITHGTDTMTQTASALWRMWRARPSSLSARCPPRALPRAMPRSISAWLSRPRRLPRRGCGFA